ncbi:flagellar basal body-associated FliL family protein [Paludibacterium yongneupense]|uniref:flagellar basal body-associated FliL family protein n=1 Tax=Paludibacterium yongneupense TaxID=400061 RepID=UPI0004213DB4|nr:flagellar basal body-associated FliL family protein [Paludibacterium yongneupense]
MAEEKKVEKEAKPAGGGSKLMLIAVVLLVLVLVAVAGVGYLFLHKPAAAGGAQAETTQTKKKDAPPAFEKLDTFVVNLTGASGSLLQVDMQAEVSDEEAKKKLTDYMPKIRSAVILLLSSKSADELATAEGKIKLKTQVKQIINQSMDAPDDNPPVVNVLFTSFIIQNQ